VTSLRKPDACRTLAAGDGSAHVAVTIAIAFEDSPNGVKAAKAAGIFTVAVPME
jgi:beta-phosphoglucomutase-like phosphatase (HAD superfamily)